MSSGARTPRPRESGAVPNTRTRHPMPLGFRSHHPGGMSDNSPMLQHWVRVGRGNKSRGTAGCGLVVRAALFVGMNLSRPFGTYARLQSDPNVETLGYYRLSLRDNPSASHTSTLRTS